MFYRGLGDALMLNSVMFELGRQRGRNHLLGTNYYELFKGNPYITLLPFKSQRIHHQIGKLLKLAGLVSNLHYLDYYRNSQQPGQHILSVLSNEAGVRQPPVKPAIYLNQSELIRAKLPDTGKPWIAIQSTGLATWTDNKNWGHQKMGKVIELLKSDYSFLQLGSHDDPSLSVDLNLSGKVSPREAICYLKRCQKMVAQEGFLMHAAAAVGVPSVIIYGGFIAPWQSGYDCNINLYTTLPCAPCFLTSPCPYGKRCLEDIKPSHVIEALHSIHPVTD